MPDLRTLAGRISGGIFPAALLACAGLILIPPAEGAMLVLPLDGATVAETTGFAARAHGRILSPGPYQGSLAIWAERETVFAADRPFPYLLVAIPFRGCS